MPKLSRKKKKKPSFGVEVGREYVFLGTDGRVFCRDTWLVVSQIRGSHSLYEMLCTRCSNHPNTNHVGLSTVYAMDPTSGMWELYEDEFDRWVRITREEHAAKSKSG